MERNAAGKITKVTFTCENPEYWDTLWMISSNKVLELYRRHVNGTVRMANLEMRDMQGNMVYNRLNKWNNSTTLGAMHLISAPNNLFAEIFLAAGATIIREQGGTIVTDQDQLIECSNFGEAGSNSDPQRGAAVNGIAREFIANVALADPVGLYIDTLDTKDFTLPDSAPAGTNPADFWKVERGTRNATLRASYAVPAELGFVVGDMQIAERERRYGAQLADHIQIKLSAEFCRSDQNPINVFPCPTDRLQGLPEPRLFQPEELPCGFTDLQVVLLAFDAEPDCDIMFEGDGVTAAIEGFEQVFVPGTGIAQAITLSVNVADAASIGDRRVSLRNPNGASGPPIGCRI